MKPDEMRRAIAEACGIRAIEHQGGLWSLIWPDGRFCPHHQGGISKEHAWNVCCPHFESDLNAMHEAEKLVLLDPFDTEENDDIVSAENLSKRLIAYKSHLASKAYGLGASIWHATAAQRAEAFLRTLNLWKEEESAVLA